jgi:uncharacterized protein
MQPPRLLQLQTKRHDILSLCRKYHTRNPRVFGSVALGLDKVNSDIDLLVDVLPDTHLIHLGGLYMELEQLLGQSIDLLTPNDLPVQFRSQVLASALPI